MTYQPDAVFIIEDLETLKIMADARRMQILEVILNQTATVKEIAEQLNQPASQLYYHINTLEKHGLIRVVDTRIVSGIIEKWYGAAAKQFQVAKELLLISQASSEGREQLFTPLFDSAKQELMTSIEQGKVQLTHDEAVEPEDGAVFMRGYRRMSKTRFQEFRTRLQEVLQEFSSDAPEDTGAEQVLYSGLVAVFPTPDSEQ
jgi:DNA-binding transcriptional ArsR family regulator